MILWVILFVLVAAISFILAANSMRDFIDIPPKDEEHGLFLIRNSQGLSEELFNSIQKDLLHSKLSFSFERLFKGGKNALVVFGPKRLLANYMELLNLLELEDYTNVKVEYIFAWEAGIKKNGQWTIDNGQKIFGNLPELSETEQFWWQVVLSAPIKSGSASFKPQITAIVVAHDAQRRHSLAQALPTLAPDKITKLPKAFSNEQLLDFYKTRSLRRDVKNPVLNSQQILELVA